MKKLNLFLALTTLSLSAAALAAPAVTAVYRCGGYADGEAFVGTVSLSPEYAQVGWSNAIGPRAVNGEGKWLRYGPFVSQATQAQNFVILVSPEMLRRSKKGGVVVLQLKTKEKTIFGCRLAQ